VASNFPIPSGDGGRPGVGSIVVETTHQKHVEENQERLIAELTNKNDELERFNYTASHDLKAPLITIRGFLGVLLEEAAAGRVDLMNDAIERIDRAAGKMQGLLEDLLDFSRVTSSRDEREQVLLTKLLDEVLELIAGQIARGNARVEVSPELPTVFADPSRLRTLFQNLIANAVKFMGDQLQPLIEVGCEQRDAELLYYVRDNGMGIDSRYHEKIFGLFDRLNPNAEGSGVGLAIARRIVELYGGRIWVQSEGRGQGCAFYFTLPQSD
jgi:signal transduction histidine kinase